MDVLENWDRLTCYQRLHKALRDDVGRQVPRDYRVPETNNTTENAIGRAGKIRHRAMRGYESVNSATACTFLLASLASLLAGLPYSSLIK